MSDDRSQRAVPDEGAASPRLTPAEHYAKAEHLIGLALKADMGSSEERYYLAAAQVHATLSTAHIGVDGGESP